MFIDIEGGGECERLSPRGWLVWVGGGGWVVERYGVEGKIDLEEKAPSGDGDQKE